MVALNQLKLLNEWYLGTVDGVPEEVVQEQVGQLRVLVVGGLDVAQEDRPDDAATAPHQGDAAIVLRESHTCLNSF